MAKIIVKLKDREIAEVPLERKTVTIGRDTGNDIHLKNPSVSRQHAKIVRHGGPYYIEDLNSTNGTFVNNRQVTWRTGLNDNDRITIGKYTLIFRESARGGKRASQKIVSDMMDATVKVPKRR